MSKVFEAKRARDIAYQKACERGSEEDIAEFEAKDMEYLKAASDNAQDAQKFGRQKRAEKDAEK